MKYRNVITQEVKISGIGLHTGKTVNISLSAGEVGTGIKFV